MTNKIQTQPFEDVYPEVKNMKPGTRKEKIALARRVATALRNERENFAKEQLQNNLTSGFSLTTS